MGSKKQRSLFGIFVQPKPQLILTIILSAGYVVVGLILMVVIASLQDILESMTVTKQISARSAVTLLGYVQFYLKLSIAICGTFAATGIALGLILSHRLYGPMVAIRAHVGRLIRGEFNSRVQTRRSDDFKDLTNDLNLLAEALEKKAD